MNHILPTATFSVMPVGELPASSTKRFINGHSAAPFFLPNYGIYKFLAPLGRQAAHTFPSDMRPINNVITDFKKNQVSVVVEEA